MIKIIFLIKIRMSKWKFKNTFCKKKKKSQIATLKKKKIIVKKSKSFENYMDNSSIFKINKSSATLKYFSNINSNEQLNILLRYEDATVSH